MYKLTGFGIKKCEVYISECKAKRKEIMDTGIDTADSTNIPTIDDIESDINYFIDEEGEYYNYWGVTDNYDSDFPLCLKLNVDFTECN